MLYFVGILDEGIELTGGTGAGGRRRRRSDRHDEIPSDPTYDRAAVAAVLDAHGNDPGRLLPILHDVQARIGHIPRGSVSQIARALGCSRAEVHGVVGFYHDFRWEPAGRRTLRLCVAESCQAAGVRSLVPLVEEIVGCRLGETTDDGAVTLEAAYCLGLCTCSPAAALDDGTVAGRLDEHGVRELVAAARAER